MRGSKILQSPDKSAPQIKGGKRERGYEKRVSKSQGTCGGECGLLVFWRARDLLGVQQLSYSSFGLERFMRLRTKNDTTSAGRRVSGTSFMQ